MSQSADPEDDLLRVCTELRERLMAGDTVRAEVYLEANPSLASDPQRAIALILAEYSARCEIGQTPDPVEWLGRFSRWSRELRPWLDLLDKGNDPQAKASPTSLTAGSGESTLPPLSSMILLGELGRGGMGTVYRAFDPVLLRVVALKRMQSGSGRPDELARFQREARAVARLHHPDILPILAMGAFEGGLAFTMPLVRGGTLSDNLHVYQNDYAAAVQLMIRVARALHHAHERGVVHRDLKPTNILLEEGCPRIADFGLARLRGDIELTQSGQKLGTPPYMAPEQITESKRATQPTVDIWSMGVILYYLLTGQRPWQQKVLADLFNAIRYQNPPRPRSIRSDIPEALEAIILHCLNKSPTARYQTAEALACDLERWQRSESISAPARSSSSDQLHRLMVVSRSSLVGLFTLAIPLVGGLMLLPTQPEVRGKLDSRIPFLAETEHRLHAGLPVTLLGSTGLPTWALQKTDLASPALTARPPELPFRLRTYERLLIELLPSVPISSYRISGQFLYRRCGDGGKVGLYLCHEGLPGGEANEHFFLQHVYRQESTGEVLHFLAGHCYHRATTPLLLGTNWRRSLACLDPSHLLVMESMRQAFVPMTAPIMLPRVPWPRPLYTTSWHTLSAEVTPAHVVLYWDGHPMAAFQWEARRKHLRQNWDICMRDVGPKLVPAPSFSAQGALGLFCCDAVADVRNVVITPLTPSE